MNKLPLSKDKAKELIHDLEYFGGGLHRLSGVGLNVANIRYLKRNEIFIANVTIYFPEYKITERNQDCEYPLKELLEFQELKKTLI